MGNCKHNWHLEKTESFENKTRWKHFAIFICDKCGITKTIEVDRRTKLERDSQKETEASKN